MNRLSSKEFKKDLAEQYKTSLAEIETIIESQFKFVADVISANNPVEGSCKTILLRDFGKFGVTPLGKRRAAIIHDKHSAEGTLQQRKSEIIFVDDLADGTVNFIE